MATPGVRITFLHAGEAEDLELPPVGPLTGVVVRNKRVVVEDAPLEPPDGSGLAIARWMAAQLELKRATGEEPGETIRSIMRLSAPDGGIYLRFGAFAVFNEEQPQPELGPFTVVLVGERNVDADGTSLATRSSKDGSWDLTREAGPSAAGARKADIGVRSASTRHHPAMASVPSSEVVDARQAPDQSSARLEALEVIRKRYAPPAPEAPREPPRTERVLKDADADLLTRAERGRAASRSVAPEPVVAPEPTPRRSFRDRVGPIEVAGLTHLQRGQARPTWRDRLWRLRFPVAGVLVVGLVWYGMTVFTGGTGGAGVRTVSIGERVSGNGWEFTVSSATRVASAGSARPRGEFLVVRMGATNRGAAGAQLSPSDFELFDRTGKRYSAESSEGAAYQSGGGPYSWLTSFPVGRAVSITLVFDIDPGAGGPQLGFRSTPGTRVNLG